MHVPERDLSALSILLRAKMWRHGCNIRGRCSMQIMSLSRDLDMLYHRDHLVVYL